MTTIIKYAKRDVAHFRCQKCECEFITDISDPEIYISFLDSVDISQYINITPLTITEIKHGCIDRLGDKFGVYFMHCPQCNDLCASVLKEIHEETKEEPKNDTNEQI